MCALNDASPRGPDHDRLVAVSQDGVEFYVEVRDGPGGGLEDVRARDALTLDNVADTIQAIAAQLVRSVEAAKPTEMEVSFGLSFSVQTGKLTGLVVEGGGGASLSVTLRWTSGPA